MMRRNFLRIFPLALALCAATLAANAESSAVQPAINQFMRGHTKKLIEQYGSDLRVEYTVASIDPEPAACQKPLVLNTKDAGQLTSRISVQVSCANAWSIYVPVDLAIFRPVVIAVKPLAPGSTIDDDDVQLAETDITQLFGQYLTQLNDVIGMSAKRAIAAGRPMLSQQLAPPLYVRRGDSVVINAESSAISIKTTGVALTDGRRGEQIRIKNPGSTRVINALVTGPGQVQAQM
jgi:flagellar basal body P-ring formation protein FlgA